MKSILKLEYLAFFILGTYGFYLSEYSWWWYFGLFFAPDISMLGYLINPKIGAFTYNLFHHFTVGIIIALIGFYFFNTTLLMIGSILIAHSAFDRILGYGLKYPDDFKNTHLGRIGK